ATPHLALQFNRRSISYHSTELCCAAQQTRLLDVRFGSKADICSAQAHVRFTANSDRESEFPQKLMSALPPKNGHTRASNIERGILSKVDYDPSPTVGLSLLARVSGETPRREGG